MTYEVLKYPVSVYPDEMKDECPEAEEAIDVLIQQMGRQGPSPAGYAVKNLGKKMEGLWQINLKVEKRQIRILYAPDGKDIVLFRIHKKSSKQEQQRAYTLAMKRKREYELCKQKLEKQTAEKKNHGTGRTIH